MSPTRTEWDTGTNPHHDLWTTSNAGEILPGVVRPLTAQLLHRTDAPATRAVLDSYPAGHRIEVPEPPAAALFGVFGGRLAVNSGLSVAVTSLLDPALARSTLGRYFTGLDDAERFMVDATDQERAGAAEVADRQRHDAADWLATQSVQLLAERRSQAGDRLATLDPAAAWARLQELAHDTAVGPRNTHLVVSMAAGEHHARLAGLLLGDDEDPELAIGLTAGLGDLESTGAALALWDLARSAREHRVVAAVLRDDGTGAVRKLIADPTDEPARRFAALFTDFGDRWGYRGQGELDPTRPDWSEDPTFPLFVVRSLLAVTDDDAPAVRFDAAAVARRELEAQVRARLPAASRPAFDAALVAAQHYTRLRELSRAVWAMAARRLRVPYLALARGLVGDGLLDAENDLAFCLFDEVDQLVTGSPIEGLDARLARRRSEADAAAEATLPAHWVGDPPADQPAPSVPSALWGVGVSAGPGPFTGPARGVTSVGAGLDRDLEVGEVLVAPFTDAAWAPALITAGAIVVESGGVLSHAATVAREFGVPCVTMVPDAMTAIPESATLTVDGAAGTVTIEPKPHDEPPAP